VKRNGLVFGVMVVGIALLLWAGWHNLRERRKAMQEARENHVVLVPEKSGSAAADSQSPEAEASQMRGKPAPDSFLAGAKALGVAPANAAVFEDALAGVEAGKAGGFGYVVGVNRANQAHALRAHGADVVVDDLADLLGDT